MTTNYVIFPLLPIGKENAISSEQLISMLQLKSKRELQQQIAKERKEGALILSRSSGGYYTSHDPTEIAEFIHTLENRAKHTFLALRSARRFLKEYSTEPSDIQP